MNGRVRAENVTRHFDSLAEEYDGWKAKASYYYDHVIRTLREIVPENRRVLELGCGTGAILEALRPCAGLGVDISPHMVAAAQRRRPWLRFAVGNAEELVLEEAFDYVVLVDLVEHLADLRKTFVHLGRLLPPETVVVCSSANPLWAPVLHAAERLGLKMPEGDHRWPSVGELEGILREAGFETRLVLWRMICPKKLGWISDFLNWIFPKLGPLSHLCLIQVVVFTRKAK